MVSLVKPDLNSQGSWIKDSNVVISLKLVPGGMSRGSNASLNLVKTEQARDAHVDVEKCSDLEASLTNSNSVKAVILGLKIA